MPLELLSAPKIMPINTVKVYEILQGKATEMVLRAIGQAVKKVAGGAINRTLSRLMGAGISTDSRLVEARAKWSGRNDKTDWRVRLQVPDASPLQKFFDF